MIDFSLGNVARNFVAGLTIPLHMLISKEREYRADSIAVQLTRDPLSLAETRTSWHVNGTVLACRPNISARSSLSIRVKASRRPLMIKVFFQHTHRSVTGSQFCWSWHMRMKMP